MEIVGMGGTDIRDVLACLCPCCGIGRVGVNHTPYLGEGAVEHKVGGGVGRGIEIAFYYFACLEVNNHHIAGFHSVVAHT